MIDVVSQLNWLAVLAAAIATFVLGGIWFGALMGKQYAVALGIADRPAQKPGALFLIGPFLCSGVTIITSAVILRLLGISSYAPALGLGTLIGVGYLVPMTLNIAINPLFPHPFHYTLLNAPYFIASSVLACAILVALA